MNYEERYTEVLKDLRVNLDTNRKRAITLGYSWEAQEQRDNAVKCIAIHDLMDILSDSECAVKDGPWAGSVENAMIAMARRTE